MIFRVHRRYHYRLHSVEPHPLETVSQRADPIRMAYDLSGMYRLNYGDRYMAGMVR